MSLTHSPPNPTSYIARRGKWAVLTAAWLSAAQDSTPDYTITLPTRREALQLRADLYLAVRRARQPRVFDQELLDAAAQCSINITDCTLRIYRRRLRPDLKMLEQTTVNQSAEASLKNLEALLQQADQLTNKPPPSSCPLPYNGEDKPLDRNVNPYFTRED